MRRFSVSILILAVAVFTVTLSAAPKARAAETQTKIGYLNCHVASGWGFILGSSRRLACVFTPSGGKDVEHYEGAITKFGADIGYLQSAVILWTVLAPAKAVSHSTGLLAGHYGGGSASATVGLGAGAHALVGGFDSSIALQPLSIEGNTGLNVAAGIATMNLKYVKK